MKQWLAAGPPVTVCHHHTEAGVRPSFCHHTTEAGVRYSFWESEVSPDEGIIGDSRLRQKCAFCLFSFML